MAEDAVDLAEPVAAACGISIKTELGASCVAGDRVLLDRLVTNLVDNPVRHNEPGGWVRIRTASQDDGCLISVENGGPNIPRESLGELTEPFRRLAGRVGSDRGCGLGLSIVPSVVSAHGGQLELRAPDGGGIEVDVLLPAARAPVADPVAAR